MQVSTKVILSFLFLTVISSHAFAQDPTVRLVPTFVNSIEDPVYVDPTIEVNVGLAVQEVRRAVLNALYSTNPPGFENRPNFFAAGYAALHRNEVLQSITRYMQVLNYYTTNSEYVNGEGFVAWENLTVNQIAELSRLHSQIKNAGWGLPDSMLPEAYRNRPWHFGLEFEELAIRQGGGNVHGFTRAEVIDPGFVEMINALKASYEKLQIIEIFNERYIRGIHLVIQQTILTSLVDTKQRYKLSFDQIEWVLRDLAKSDFGIFGKHKHNISDYTKLNFTYLDINVLELIRAEVHQVLNEIIDMAELEIPQFPVNESALNKVRFARYAVTSETYQDPRAAMVREAAKRAFLR